MNLKITREDPHLTMVEISGNVVGEVATIGRDPLAQEFGSEIYSKQVAFSLRNSEYADSSGVGWLVALHERFEANGGRLYLHSPRPALRRLLQTMRMDLILNLLSDEAEVQKRVADSAASSSDSTENSNDKVD